MLYLTLTVLHVLSFLFSYPVDIRDSVTNQDNTIAAIVVTLFVLLVIVLFCVAVVSYKLFRHKSRRKRPDPMRYNVYTRTWKEYNY